MKEHYIGSPPSERPTHSEYIKQIYSIFPLHFVMVIWYAFIWTQSSPKVWVLLWAQHYKNEVYHRRNDSRPHKGEFDKWPRMDTLKPDRELYMRKAEMMEQGETRYPGKSKGGSSWTLGTHVTFPGFCSGLISSWSLCANQAAIML